jgi:hypothetical protein
VLFVLNAIRTDIPGRIIQGNNQQVINYANKYLPVIQMHLQEAQNIQQLIQ